jgi:hypothetical protein
VQEINFLFADRKKEAALSTFPFGFGQILGLIPLLLVYVVWNYKRIQLFVFSVNFAFDPS